ncbi:MAG: UDP-N-acetyl glucosamine 2-epimerase [Halorientalis sp.]
MKVVSVVDNRSQLLKALPVSRALETEHSEVLVYTGTEYETEIRGSFFESIDSPAPDVSLDVDSRPDSKQTAALLSALDDVVGTHQPDVVLVYGETNATLAGALVGAKRETVVAHVEAGLHRHDRDRPEEIDRILADHCRGALFVPSERTKRVLEGDGISQGVYNTGDVMYDSILSIRDQARSSSTAPTSLDGITDDFVLAALHRTSSLCNGDRLEAILRGFAASPRPVVLLSNPRLDDALARAGWLRTLPANVIHFDRLDYLEYVGVVDQATCVATDSNRVQKEAFYVDTPCVTLRDSTAWIETVACGWNVLVGTESNAIARNLERAFELPTKPSPYGSGDAAGRIVSTLASECLDADRGPQAEQVTI